MSDKIEYAKSPTEGEQVVYEFLESLGIEFIHNCRIEGLKYDTASCRIADFYIPKFDLVIEFNGAYRTEAARYREKREAYKKNGVPFIELYPDNLGVLGSIFWMRVRKSLEESNSKKLRKFKWFMFNRGIDDMYFFFAWFFLVSFLFLIHDFTDLRILVFILVIILTLPAIAVLILSINKYFGKQKKKEIQETIYWE